MVLTVILFISDDTDTQLYITVPPGSAISEQVMRLEACIADIKQWMLNNNVQKDHARSI